MSCKRSSSDSDSYSDDGNFKKLKSDNNKNIKNDDSTINKREIIVESNESKKMSFIELEKIISNFEFEARVINKTEVITYSSGKLFKLILLDENSEMKCTAFNENVDKFINEFEVGKVYTFQKLGITMANSKYTHLNNVYELIIKHDSIIKKINNVSNIPNKKYNILPLNLIDLEEDGKFIDTIGIIKTCYKVENIKLKSGANIIKRDIILTDQDQNDVPIVLWNKHATELEFQEKTLILIKSCKVTEYNHQKKLSVVANSTVCLELDEIMTHDEGKRLQEFLKNED